MKKKIFKLISLSYTIITFGAILLSPMEEVNAVRKNTAEDVMEGTADDLIEKAIAKGKTIAGFTEYELGAVQINPDYLKMDKPPTLDCSGFTAWAYRNGAGLGIKANPNVPNSDDGIITTYGMESYFGKHYKTGASIDEVKRGDLILTANMGHVVIYLGNGQTLGCDGASGYGQIDTTGGVNITAPNGFNIETFTGNYVDMTSAVKDESIWNIIEVDEIEYSSSMGQNGLKGVVNSDFYNPFKNYNRAKGQLALIDNGSSLLGRDTISTIQNFSSQIAFIMQKVLWFGGAIFIFMISFMLCWYVALPYLNVSAMDNFEKFMGIPAIRDKENTIAILTTYTITMFLLVSVLSNLYVYPLQIVLDNVGQLVMIFGR